MHEMYEYRVTQYDLKTGNSGLFAQYIGTFLELKADASEYPNWVQCCDEDRYVSDFTKSEGT